MRPFPPNRGGHPTEHIIRPLLSSLHCSIITTPRPTRTTRIFATSIGPTYRRNVGNHIRGCAAVVLITRLTSTGSGETCIFLRRTTSRRRPPFPRSRTRQSPLTFITIRSPPRCPEKDQRALRRSPPGGAEDCIDTWGILQGGRESQSTACGRRGRGGTKGQS